MYEDEMARKAVERGLLTEVQLREARTFAEGGHSILSVLLDLGYLKPDELLELAETRPAGPQTPFRRRPWPLLLALAGVAVVAFLMGSLVNPERRVYVRDPVAVQAVARAHPHEELHRRGVALLHSAEQVLRDSGNVLTPDARSMLERAHVLLEESFRDTPDRVSLPLARSRELLRLWISAGETYAVLVRNDPSSAEALIGVARIALARSQAPLALDHAERACRLPNPRAEAFLLRGRAKLALDRNVDARDDLLKAEALDGSLSSQVQAILSRKQE